jgi:hypothetical protein
MSAAPWAELVARAEREYELILQERWEEAAEAGSARLEAARALGAPSEDARPLLERLAQQQAQITAALATARAFTLRKLGGMHKSHAAVRGYVTAGYQPRHSSLVDGRG